jgi:macrolide-specific efflux system membrane fusion protein
VLSLSRNAVRLAGVLALLMLSACLPNIGSKAPRYLTEKVAVGEVEKTVLATGALQPLEVVSVGAQATGQIQELKVQLGDTVKRGQLIAIIDPATQQNTLRNAEAALAAQQAQRASQEARLYQDELSVKRQADLLRTGYAAQAAYDAADASVKVSRASLKSIDAQVRQAQISVEKAKVDLGYTTINAPIDGVVASILVRQGQTVNAVQAAPTLVRIAKMDVMTVKAQISEADVINVRPGQQVYFTILGDPDKRYYATLRGVEPAPESAANASDATGGFTATPTGAIYYNALFDVPNSDGRLRASMTAQVNVVLADVKNVLTTPSAALGKREADGRYAVRVLGPRGAPVERKVRIGLNNSVVAQVLDGLKRGDEVILGDALALKPNAANRQQ